jgi:hypothetical protein
MGRSTTWLMRSATLSAGDPKVISVLLRLMMVVNDVGLANNAVHEWDKLYDRKKSQRTMGGKLYFVRMQMAHIYEGLLIVDDIRKSAELREEVEACDWRTIRAFEKLVAFMGSADYERLLRLRNNAAFHYDGKLGLRSLQRLTEEFPSDVSGFSMGETTLDWYCEVADKVLDRLLMRFVYEIPKGPTQVQEADAIHLQMFEMAQALGDFAAHFVREYCARNLVFA